MRHILADLAVAMTPKSYLRVTPMAHAAAPLGAGFKVTRFASPTKTFKVIYLAQDLTTAIAETLVRDRFQGCKTACKSFQIPHALCLNAFYRYAVITCLETTAKQSSFSEQAPGLAETASAKAIDARDA
jgi:RES domain-containing protein